MFQTIQPFFFCFFFFFFLVKPLTRMVERDHAINKFLCLQLTFLLIVFSFIVEETSGESFPLEQRCSSFGLGGNGAATEWLWRRRKKYEKWNKDPNLSLWLNVEFLRCKRKYEGEIRFVVSSIRFRLYTEIRTKKRRTNTRKWNSMKRDPPLIVE